ncbi:hypothetical protein [Nonomuraea lactucae]|uniref:hypothetical protein n=1 Tax=Nonomuraea lactucae TaxID=2249762 RepID=UPI000DE4B81E|nr:hypothetical protein [Nonomuraea lactucae]
MAGFYLQFQALKDGQAAAGRLSKHYTELAGGYPAKGTDSTIFGRLDGAFTLAALLDRVESEVGDELRFAQRRVRSVESTLDKVWDVVRRTNRANGAGDDGTDDRAAV